MPPMNHDLIAPATGHETGLQRLEPQVRRRFRRSRNRPSGDALIAACSFTVSWLRRRHFAVAYWLTVCLALASELPWVARPLREHILQGTLIGLFTYLAAMWRTQEPVKRMLLRGPSLWMLLLFAWCLFETICPNPLPIIRVDELRPFADAEFYRILLCIGVYIGAAYLMPDEDIKPAVFGVIALGVGVSIDGIAGYGSGRQDEEIAIFGNHEQLGSFLILVLPVALAISRDMKLGRWIYMCSQGATLILAGAVLLSLTRSAWLGAIIGVAVVAAGKKALDAFRRYRTGSRPRQQVQHVVLSSLILVVGVGAVFFSRQLFPIVTNRAATFSSVLDDLSFMEREHRWKAASKMTYQRPITGWGLGAFPVIQRHWTHGGLGGKAVIKNGAGHPNLAHNFWVQWASETGVIGLVLYAGMAVAFLISGTRALFRMRGGFSRTLLLGTLGAVAASCVDMAGAPSYTFPGVSSLQFLWMGLGMAACRSASGNESEPDAAAILPAWGVSAALGVGLAAAGIVLYAGAH